jgi:hypothetical protein
VLAALGLMVISSPARAGVALVSGTSVATPGEAYPASAVLVDKQTFTFGPLSTGTLQVDVFKETTGTLDFLYQVTNSHGAGTKLISSIGGLSNYSGFTTSVDYNNAAALSANFLGSGLVLGAKTSSSAARDGMFPSPTDGSNVSFSLSSNLAASGVTKILFVQTDARSYDSSGTAAVNFFHDGSFGFNNVFEPAVVTPEPSTLSLLGLGGVGLVSAGALYRRRLRISPSMA